jgi:vesicular inhibitory amino acid transporter
MVEDSKESYQAGAPATIPPSYSELFSKEHSQALDESISHSNSAVILKVTNLDDTGKQLDVQWKYDHDGYDKEGGHGGHNAHGFGILITGLFIIGEIVGGGIISMPNALFRQGWGGIAVIVIVSFISGFTGVQLGRCWTILQERWPSVYLKHTQKPYPEIGFRAGGRWCKRFVSLCLQLTLFGTATVFLIIVGQNVARLTYSFAPWVDFSFCYFILFAGLILLPFTYLGSPADFWQVSFGAAGSTTIAVIIMLIGMSQKYNDDKASGEQANIEYPPTTFVNFILGYGTVMFAYTGQSAFPTIQHDMKKPELFPKAIIWSYGIIFFYYLPVSILGYIVYGQHLGDAGIDNVLSLLPAGWIQDTVTILITLHVMFGFIIFVNPINQELESVLNIPPKFSIKRVITRSIVVLFIIFLAESIPSMNLLLDLVGGTAMAFLGFVFPGTFYLALRWRTTTKVSEADKPIQKWEYPVTAVIVLIGILGAIGSIYAFVETVITGGNGLFRVPCFIDNRNNITSS